MFDLERRIQEWRRSLADALGGRAEALDELENHVREEWQRLVQSGQAPERAWETALGRLGSPRQLAEEFGKLPPGRAFWLPARAVEIVLAVLAVGLGVLLLSRLQSGTLEPLLAGHLFTVTVGYTAGFAVGALALWSLLTRALDGWDERRGRALRSAAWRLTAVGLGLTAVGVALGCWWARDHLGRWWAWDLREIGGLGVLAWNGLLLACLLRPASGGLLATRLGAAGGVVVCLSWFGPALAGGGPSAGHSALLVGFALAQLLILGVALLPGRWLARQRA